MNNSSIDDDDDCELTFGKHKGRRYRDVMLSDIGYCRWATKEVVSSSAPEARLAHFAAWCVRWGVTSKSA